MKARSRKRKTRRVRRTKSKGQRGGDSEQVYHFHNEHHYGDNILNLKFFFANNDILKKNNIKVFYYYNPGYIKNADELQAYVNTETLTLLPIDKKPANSVQLWMGNEVDGISWPTMEVYFDKFYKNIASILKLDPNSINTSIYQPDPQLLDIYNKLDPKYNELDILIINTEPQSGQFEYNKEKFDNLCIELSKKYKIATANFVNNNIPCTLNDKLRMKDIGAISTHSKNIIAIHSGPFTACLNEYAKQYVKKWFLLSKDNAKYTQINTIYIHTPNDISKIIPTLEK